jgi:hypothetical protein
MTRPSTLSIIPIPQQQFPGLAITQRDFRLNFCINNGSKTMPSMVPIYSPAYLDELLDEMTALMLLMNTEIDLYKKTVVLPKVSMHDFNTNHHPNNHSHNNHSHGHGHAGGNNAAGAAGAAAPIDCLRTLLCYLSKEDRASATRIITEGMHVNIRFKAQSLRCRKLRVYNPNTPLSVAATALLGGIGGAADGDAILASYSSNTAGNRSNAAAADDREGPQSDADAADTDAKKDAGGASSPVDKD